MICSMSRSALFTSRWCCRSVSSSGRGNSSVCPDGASPPLCANRSGPRLDGVAPWSLRRFGTRGRNRFNRTGISVDLGIGMLLLAGIWFIFRREVVNYRLWVAGVVYGVQVPAEPQVRTAESVAAWIRSLLCLAGLFIILTRFIMR